MKSIFIISNYFSHFFKSKSKRKIHSPFVYDLLTKVFTEKVPDAVKKKIKNRRKSLLSNKTILEIVDFGAGSSRRSFWAKTKSINSDYKAEFKTVRRIAKSSVLRQKYANLIYNLVSFSQPKVVVELGTSLGVTTGMMAMAAPSAKIYSLEGCASVAAIAQSVFEKLKLDNIELKLGEFKTVLPEVISKLDHVDFVFFDGNHRKEATINYFEQFLPLKTNDTIFVFDDIYWSKGMKEAWQYIKNHPETVVTIDLFEMGIVFFRKELTPQHFVYRF